MISNRTRGIASLTTACQCVLTLLLFSLWIVLYHLVSGATRFNLEAYGTYGLFFVLGLLFDSVIRNPAPTFGLLRQPNLVQVMPRALRQAFQGMPGRIGRAGRFPIGIATQALSCLWSLDFPRTI